MKFLYELTDPQVAALLSQGSTGIIPTDESYSLITTQTQLRNTTTLIAARDQINNTDNWSAIHWRSTKKYWPGAINMALPGASTPVRLPDYPELRVLLKRTGPLIVQAAPVSIDTIRHALRHFGQNHDFCVDIGKIPTQIPTNISFNNDKINILSQGIGTIAPEDLG